MFFCNVRMPKPLETRCRRSWPLVIIMVLCPSVRPRSRRCVADHGRVKMDMAIMERRALLTRLWSATQRRHRVRTDGQSTMMTTNGQLRRQRLSDGLGNRTLQKNMPFG